MLQNTAAAKYTYSLKTTADFKGKILENNLTGLVMLVNDQEVHFRLIGEFNAYNLLAVFGAAICLGEEKAEILRNLSRTNRSRRKIRLYDFAKRKNRWYRGLCTYSGCIGKCAQHHTKTEEK